MNGMQSHSHVPAHTNIYFIWLVKKFVLQVAFCIDHQQIDKSFCLPSFGRSQRKSILLVFDWDF